MDTIHSPPPSPGSPPSSPPFAASAERHAMLVREGKRGREEGQGRNSKLRGCARSHIRRANRGKERKGRKRRRKEDEEEEEEEEEKKRRREGEEGRGGGQRGVRRGRGVTHIPRK